MAVTSLRRRIHFKTIFDICDDDHLSRNLLAILLERLVRFQALTKHSRRTIITKRQHFLTPLSLLHIKFSLASSCIVFIPLDFTLLTNDTHTHIQPSKHLESCTCNHFSGLCNKGSLGHDFAWRNKDSWVHANLGRKCIQLFLPPPRHYRDVKMWDLVQRHYPLQDMSREEPISIESKEKEW